MNIFIAFLSVIFSAGVGFLIIRLCDLLDEKSKLLILGYSYGLGVGVISLQLYLYSRFNFGWSVPSILLPWFLLLLLYIKKNNVKFKIDKIKFRKLSKSEIFLIILIIIPLFYTFIEALIRPVAVWDGWAIWLLKSKIFFIDGRINPSSLNYVRSDYPLIISLMGTFIYIMMGRIDDTAVLLSFYAFYAFLALSFFSLLQYRFGRKYALFFTFLLVSLQNLIRHGGRFEVGQADLALGYFIFICTNLLLKYLKDNNLKTLILLNIFLGLTGLIKFEGIPFTIAVQIIVLHNLYKSRSYSRIFTGLFWFFPIFDWQVYKVINNVSISYFQAHHFVYSAQKMLGTFYGVLKELLNIKSWNLMWISYFYSVVAYRLAKHRELIVINSLLLFQLFVYILVYDFTRGNSPVSSIERLLVHIAPLAMLSVSILIRYEKPAKNLKSSYNTLFVRLGLKQRKYV